MTAGLTAIWFAPAALVSMVLAIFKLSAAVQISVFVILSGLLMLIFYKKVRDNIETKSEKTNLDAIIGKEAVVEEEIGEKTVGRVKVGGISWSAFAEKGTGNVKKGEYVTVLAIDGVKLCCKKSNTSPAVEKSEDCIS